MTGVHTKPQTPSLLHPLQVRDKKPDPPPALGEGAQVTVVGATLSGRMLKKITALVPVSGHLEMKFSIQFYYKMCRILRRYPAKGCIRFCHTLNRSLSKLGRTKNQVKMVCWLN